MRKLLLSMCVVMFAIVATAQQKQVVQLTAAENKLELKSVNPESFSARITVKELGFKASEYADGIYSILEVEGMSRPNNVGQANLPVISRLIEVPYGAEIQVNILGYTEEVINLDDYGISRIEPTQPSYSKSTSAEDQVFVIDENYYNTDSYETTELVETEIYGVMRGVRMGGVTIRPYHYNPVENTLIIYNNLDFEVVFVNADLATTEEMKSRYFSKEFQGSYSTFLNYQEPNAAKDAFSNFNAPLKYVIVANSIFESTLQPFVEWKTKMGYNVIEYYVASGTTNTAIKTYLQNLYNAGTSSDPAPLYVLIIGDHSGNYAIPGFASTNTGSGGTDHITDLYFATLAGSDYLPDLYYGRISANTTTELQNALNKILPYEQYTIADGSYLNNCMMIAGVDATNAHTFGDAQILYGIANYYNNDHTGDEANLNYTNIWAYFYNNATHEYNVMASSNSGAAASILGKIQTGVGFANYTAHCSADGWADPTIDRADIASFNNAGKYPFMIGNCCQSFMFDESDAFGEMLLYTANEGAVGYIGTSQYSYWYEDAWWGMGNTSLTLNATNWASHTYANTGLGAYDGVWHINGEAYSNWYYSGRQMVHKGNVAVQASTSGYKQYYWEIYHLVGDPSLIPYTTEPEALSLSFANPMQGATTLTVNTEPYTYVAISKNNVLLDAEWSGSGTSVTLTVPAFNGETYCVVGTKQDRSPYINESVVPTAANPPVAAFSGTPTTILEGQSVTFTDASQYPASWSWNFGDSQTSTEQNPVHTYTTAGTYTVSLTVANGIGSDTETKTNYITVNPNTNPPTANFVASATAITVGGTISFTDLSVNNPTSWSWAFEGATPSTSTDQNPVGITYPTAGTYSVTLTATNAYGSDAEVKTGYIIVSPPSYCDANSAAEDEYISNVTFNTINNTSTWSTGGYGDYTAQSTSVIQGSTYPISITNAINYSLDQVIVWIDYNIDGDFEDTGEQVYFGAQTGTTTSNPYTWTGNVVVPASTAIGLTRMRVRLNYNSATYNGNSTPCGESGYGEVEDYTINLTSPAIPPTASFTASGPEFCAGEVTFTDASTLADTWSWNFGDGNTSTEQNPIHNYTVSGTYTVQLTVTNAYGTDTDTQTDLITIDIPVAPTTTGASACGPASLTLNASGSGTLAWYDAATNGNQITTGTSYTNSFSNTTTLYVQSQIETPITDNVGPVDYSFGAGGNLNSNTDHGLIFDVSAPVRIVSVVVWSSTTGNKTITLKNSGGTTLASQTVNITTANVATTVTLNFDVPVGTGYQLLGGTLNRLYRNTAGASYPYSIDGVVSIVNNTAADLNYYYYFYNWTVEYDVICSSARTPVTATINTLPTVNLGSDQTVCGGTVTLDAGAGHTSYVWNGTAGTQTYNASTTGAYTVVVSNAQGCTASDIANVTINALPTVVSVTGGGTQCGGSMTLTASNGGSGTIYWQGTTSGGTSTATASASQTVSTSGTYYFRARSAEGCWGPEGSATVTINSLPSDVTVAGGGSFCGGTATLTATGGTGGTIYWQNTTNNGTSTATASASQTVSSSGTYYFRAQSAQGCWGNQGSAVVTINPVVDITLSATDESAPGANDGTATVTVNSGTPAYDYNWNVAGSTASLTGLTGGSYCVTVSDANGCEDIACVTVNTIGAPPVADFEADVTLGCDNMTVNFNDLSVNNPTSWAWDFGDGNSSSLQNPTNVYNAPGTYTVTLVATNINGSDTEIITDMIIVGETPTLVMSMTQESQTPGMDGTASVTVTGGLAPYSFEWTGGYTTDEITGLEADNYCVTVTESNGCTVSDCINVTQEDPLTPPVADFEADETMGCETLTVQFTDLSTNNPTTWAWEFGDGATSDVQNPEHTYSTTGLFTVTLTVTNEDGSDVVEMADMIFVGSAPTVSVDVVQASGELIADGSAEVVITGGTAPYDILWSNDETTTAIENLLPGNYSVMVVDAAGCIVTNPFVISWTNSIDNSTISMSIFPNPASDLVTVNMDGAIAERISVTNTLGQVVIEFNPNSSTSVIDFSNIEPGVYFINVNVDGKVFNNKIVIRK